jgi:hypothetical protein
MCVVNTDGRPLLSMKLANDEAAMTAAIGKVAAGRRDDVGGRHISASSALVLALHV